MNTKKELLEENARLISEAKTMNQIISEYAKKNSMLVKDRNEKIRDSEDHRKLCKQLDKTLSEDTAIIKGLKSEIRDLKDELFKLSDVKTVMAELNKCLSVPSNILEDVNKDLARQISELKAENDSLKLRNDSLMTDLQLVSFLTGKVEAYELIWGGEKCES